MTGVATGISLTKRGGASRLPPPLLVALIVQENPASLILSDGYVGRGQKKSDTKACRGLGVAFSCVKVWSEKMMFILRLLFRGML